MLHTSLTSSLDQFLGIVTIEFMKLFKILLKKTHTRIHTHTTPATTHKMILKSPMEPPCHLWRQQTLEPCHFLGIYAFHFHKIFWRIMQNPTVPLLCYLIPFQHFCIKCYSRSKVRKKVRNKQIQKFFLSLLVAKNAPFSASGKWKIFGTY